MVTSGLTDRVNVDLLITGYEYDANGPATSLSFHHDHLNSVTAITGHDGSTLASFRYDPFGKTTSSDGSTQVKLRYTGRELDDTGLYYYRARYYDPEIGRFLTEDPLRFQAGVNFYTYVGNNPVNANDPSGLDESYPFGIFPDPTGGRIILGGYINSASVIGYPIIGVGSGNNRGPDASRVFTNSVVSIDANFVSGSGNVNVADSKSIMRRDPARPINEGVGNNRVWGQTLPNGGVNLVIDLVNGNNDFLGRINASFTMSMQGGNAVIEPFPSFEGYYDNGTSMTPILQVPQSEFWGLDVYRGLGGEQTSYDFDSLAASGGYVLYPSRRNLNMTRRVNAK